MFEVRDDEPSYAFIPNVDTPQKNQWGKDINLVDEDDLLAGKSLNINGDSRVGNNPNRYKQHGFHFTADNCIGCHACEAACSEKNDLPAHISFRSVGYVEGGSYPAYRRLNISMACNHCDDPVCLKGCPTRAYTKFAEYGAVLQDPDICFGCGYCTWVCPYNAPQLDPVKGQVSKCNMCVDRLEVGLKPACAAACLGGALDFGIIESTPENRDQAKIQIPGFPSPDITNPNIRFQQVKNLPRDMARTDTTPVRYQRDEQGQGDYKVKATLKKQPRQWGFEKLRSREDPLVIFTLVTQGVVGAFLLLFLGPMFGLEVLSAEAHPATRASLLFGLLGLQIFALVLSTMHLGKPHRFYRAFNNLRYSPVSREVAAVAIFFNLMVVYSLLDSFPDLLAWLWQGAPALLKAVCGWGAVVFGPLAIYAMHNIYRIKARPFWNHWQVLTSFFGSVLTLGALSVGVVYATVLTAQQQGFASLMQLMSLLVVLGLMLEAVGLMAHARYLERTDGEAAASMQEQRTRFGKTYTTRNILLGVNAIAVLVFAALALEGIVALFVWAIISASIMMTALAGRALFYVLVVPTTMPGAFFWKNQGFQEHARQTGLAKMPQVGVLPEVEYPDLQKQRAIRELKDEWQKLRARGVKTAIRNRWRAVFAKA
ncbi:MAG: dimethyl sulfoxide reductase anchor subunit [Gammaproteobacteria bacterium]|nr:dimethyl sulfoxide reductase anchor subunit [Gammaproteobacteria bacterium]